MTSFKKRINNLRRSIMRALTDGIGTTQPNSHETLSSESVTRVLVSRPNHRLGNLLLMTPLVQELSDVFPNATIDLFVKGDLAPLVFQNYSKVGRIVQLPKKPFKNLWSYITGWLYIRQTKYDIVINVINHSSSGRLSAKFSKARFRFFGDDGIEKGHPHLAQYPVLTLRESVKSLGVTFAPEKPVPGLSIHLSKQELDNGKGILHGLVDKANFTICFFTNATGDKDFDAGWWIRFYDELRTAAPDAQIIEILPVENVSKLNFQTPVFADKNIRTVASVIAATDMFIGGDSGVMHLAASTHTPTVGLFKASDMASYAPYGHHSFGINTNEFAIPECVQIVAAAMRSITH